jgi:hypothetical protein
LAEEQARGLYSFDGRDLSVELEELHGHVARLESERAAEAVQLSQSIMEISDALVNLGMFPIRDIPADLKSAQDVLTTASLILEHLGRNIPLTLVPGVETWHVRRSYSPRLSHPPSFFAFCMYVMYISIFLHILMYKDIGKFVSLHSCVPAPQP